MGTNYYLLRRTTFDPNHRLPASLGCDDGMAHHPVELTNGWLWDNTYYPTLEALNERYYQRIHIGKSSCGWRFSLCIYPLENPRFLKDEYYHERYLDQPILSLDDWIALFEDPENIIVDEYDRAMSSDKMRSIICERKGSVEADEDGYTKRREGYRERYRVINGLCVHSPWRTGFDHSPLLQIMPDECTYDLLLSGNDVESAYIFS